MSLPRDPAKVRAWQQRSAAKAQANRRERAKADPSYGRLKPRAEGLRPVSAKRAKVNRERRKALHDRYGPNPPCFACPIFRAAGIATGCNGQADDGHEVMSRERAGRRDENLTDPDGVLPVGRRCHDRITTEPGEAATLGLALHSWEAPADDR